MNYVNYLHMHLHGHAFVNIAITASSIISEYIWLFLCCSIGKKYEVKRAVFSSQIYHLPAMTGYINMPFILDPRGDLITTQTYTEQSQGNPKKKKKSCLLTNMMSDQTSTHLMMKTTATTTSATSVTQHETNGKIVAEPGKGRKEIVWFRGWG